MTDGQEMDSEQVNILLVDDRPDGILALRTTLEPLGQNLVVAHSGKEALRLLLRQDFALVLLDVVMPEMDGFETAQFIRDRERSRYTPIIFLTALSGGEMPQLRAYAMGAVDYVLKPYQPEIVRSKVSVFIDLAWKTELVRRQGAALIDAQRREHERALQEAVRTAEADRTRFRAEEFQRALQIRDEFLSVASHELRTPLTAMKLSLHATKTRLDNAGPSGVDLQAIRERFGRIDRSVTKLGALVEELLDVSRLSMGRLELQLCETNLTELAEEVVSGFQDEATRAGCELKLRLEPAVVGVWDAFRIDQVITNLVSNALKYARGAPVEVELSLNAEGAVLVVRDHGTGIAPEHHERIFERFERAVEGTSVSGFGLGLWIVRQIVSAMGGVVSVQSRISQGAAFTVLLPTRVTPQVISPLTSRASA